MASMSHAHAAAGASRRTGGVDGSGGSFGLRRRRFFLFASPFTFTLLVVCLWSTLVIVRFHRRADGGPGGVSSLGPDMEEYLTNAQRNRIRQSICKPNAKKAWKVWNILCSENFAEEVAARLLAGGEHDAVVVQIGAHVGFERNDPIAMGLSGLLHEVVEMTGNDELRRRFHWVFVEPSPPNYKRLVENLAKRASICDMRAINAAVVSDLTSNPGEMVFYSIRDTIDPETGFDSLSNQSFPFWITQISGFGKRAILNEKHKFSDRGLDINDYIVETNVSALAYSDLMRLRQLPVQDADKDKVNPPLLVLVDTEGFDCDIVEGISPDSPFLPKYLVFEHTWCTGKGKVQAREHLHKMGYHTHDSGADTVAVRRSPGDAKDLGTAEISAKPEDSASWNEGGDQIQGGVVFLKTSDRMSIASFYYRLGMMPQPEQQPGVGVTILKHGNMVLGFRQIERPDVRADVHGTIAFTYKSRALVDEVFDRLQDVAIGRPVQDEINHVYWFFAKDPEGRELEFRSPYDS